MILSVPIQQHTTVHSRTEATVTTTPDWLNGLTGIWVGHGPKTILVDFLYTSITRAGTCTVDILHFRQVSGNIPRVVDTEVDTQPFLTTRFCSYQHNTVGTFRSIQYGSFSSFQDFDRSNIFGVDIIQTRTVVTTRTAIIALSGIGIMDRNSINHDQRTSRRFLCQRDCITNLDVHTSWRTGSCRL